MFPIETLCATQCITSGEATKYSWKSACKQPSRLISVIFPFFLQRYYIQHFFGSRDNSHCVPLLPIIPQRDSAREHHSQIPDARPMVCPALGCCVRAKQMGHLFRLFVPENRRQRNVVFTENLFCSKGRKQKSTHL